MKPTKQRLKEAMDHSGTSRNELHKALSAKGVRGSSYGSVRNYLGGREPPLEFLLAAAEYMKVNSDYLAYGKGHLTKAHEASAEVAAEARPEVEDWGTGFSRDLRDAVLREMGIETPTSEESWRELEDHLEGLALPDDTVELMKEAHHRDPVPYWVAPLGEVWRKLQEFQDQSEGPTDQWKTDQMIGQVAQTLAAPLKALGVDGREMQRFELFGHYIAAMIPPLLFLVREYNRQQAEKLPEDRYNDYLRNWPEGRVV